MNLKLNGNQSEVAQLYLIERNNQFQNYNQLIKRKHKLIRTT